MGIVAWNQSYKVVVTPCLVCCNNNFRLNWIEDLGTRHKSGGGMVLSSYPIYSFGLIMDVIVFHVPEVNYMLGHAMLELHASVL